jgi:YihY family inner membrane protein
MWRRRRSPIEQTWRPGKYSTVSKLQATVDELQKRYRLIAFIWAVQKKFDDDRGGYLAALITYYGFLSIFPLLLAAFTIVAYALSGDTAAIRSLESHIGGYPIIGPAATQLEGKHLQGSPLALTLGLILLIWGSMGLANAAQHAMGEIWNVPTRTRPTLLTRLYRGLAWYTVFGVGIVITTFLTSLGAILKWSGGPALSTLLALVLNIVLFAISFRIVAPAGVTARRMLPGAIMAGTAWSFFTGVGIGLAQKLAHSNELYGSFTSVLGLIAFLYLTARVTIYSIEANAVKDMKLWPRALSRTGLEPADREQLTNLARKAERVPDQVVTVRF